MVLQSILYNYSLKFTLGKVTKTITGARGDAVARTADDNNKKIMFKNIA